MKKLSKILNRRLGRSSEASAEADRPTTRDSSPEFHQLSPRRPSGGPRSRSFPRSGSSHIVADADDEPPLPPLPKDEGNANGVEEKQLPPLKPPPKLANGSHSRPSSVRSTKTTGTTTTISSAAPKTTKQRTCPTCKRINFPRLLNWQPGEPRPWVTLSHVLADDASTTCPYCIFFQAMVGTAALDGTGKFAPYLRIRLAFERFAGVSEKHELGRQVLIEITTRDKSLPWGYIMRADPGEEDEAESTIDTPAGGKAPPNGSFTQAESDRAFRKGSVASYLSKDPLIRGRRVPSLLDQTLPRTWIDFCKEHHKDQTCGKAKFTIPELKLVDCDTRSIVAAKDLKENEIEYVALSYVQGANASFATSDLEADKTPPLISDAIQLTKALGFRYLWVDHYCMPPAGDIKRRSQLDSMGDIFGNAALTVVVAAGESIGDGIPGVSVHREEQLSLKTQTGLFLTTLLRPDLDIGGSQWSTQGWTFQEGLLSRRRLVLTPAQAYFQCQALHCHESIALPLHYASHFDMGRAFPNLGEAAARPGHIRNQIKSYMSRTLSDPADRLDAFRGVLQHYARMEKPVDHFLGLPLFHPDDFRSTRVVSQTDRLAVGLSWMADRAVPSQESVDPYARHKGRTEKESHSAFPSWTWLAWHLRPDQAAPGHVFRFNLVDEASPVADGVVAAPGLEISVGFDNDAKANRQLPSWEIDGDAISKKADHVRYLRLETFCFDLIVRKEGDTISLLEPALGRLSRQSITTWFRSFILEGVTTSARPTDEGGIDGQDMSAPNGTKPGTAPASDGDYTFFGMLISGRNWAAPTSPIGESVATVLICTRERPRPVKVVSMNGLSAAAVAQDKRNSLEANGDVKLAEKEIQKDNTSKEDEMLIADKASLTGQEPEKEEQKEQPQKGVVDKDSNKEKTQTEVRREEEVQAETVLKEEAQKETTLASSTELTPHDETDEGNLVRLGAISLSYDGFLTTTGDTAVMKGIDPQESGEKQKERFDLTVRRREVDIY